MACFGVLAALNGSAFAQDSTEARLKALEEQVSAQNAEIQRLRRELGRPAAANLDSELDAWLGKGSDEGWWSEPNTFRSYWDKGLRFQTADRQFTLKVGGRLMWDAAWFVDDDDAKTADQYEVRRARLYVEGDVYGSIFFKTQYDFAGEKVAFKDMYVGADLDFAKVTVGNQYEPFGLECMTSSKYITFMERSHATDLSPERNPGIKLSNEYLDGTLTAALGWFWQNGDSKGRIENNLTGRVTWAPWFENKGEHLAHLGIAVSHRKPKSMTWSPAFRPGSHLAPKLLDLGKAPATDAEKVLLLGLEAAVVCGPFSVQGEYVRSNVTSTTWDDPTVSSYYVFASYFLTGEHRAYKKGLFDRVSPIANAFDGQGGAGAWEVALRYESVSADDGNLKLGTLSDITFGVNWYLNPNTRIMLNYVDSTFEPGSGSDIELRLVEMRFQIDF